MSGLSTADTNNLTDIINDCVAYITALAGENEIKEGKLTLKNMLTGEQQLLTPDELVAKIKA